MNSGSADENVNPYSVNISKLQCRAFWLLQTDKQQLTELQ